MRGKILIINNKEYQLIWSSIVQDIEYIYLINTNDYSDIIFAKLMGNNIEIIDNKEELLDVINMITKQITTFIL